MTPVRVRFNGEEYWWLRDECDSDPLAYAKHCDDEGQITLKAALFEESYAHVFEDGQIFRYREVIGHRDQLEEVGK